MNDRSPPLPPVFLRRDWMLDDERTGLPFLERSRKLGIHRVCVHKGLSMRANGGSPKDIGPVARMIRAFQIPDDLCRMHAYPKLTPEIRAKILGRNAARFYAIDLETVRRASMTDDVAWTQQALRDGLSD